MAAKEELKEELAKLGQPTDGVKAELEERLEDAKEELGLVQVIEGDPKVLKENDKLAEEQAQKERDAPTVPEVIEARKID